MDVASAVNKDTGLRSAFLWNAMGVIWLLAGAVQVASFVFHLTPVQLPVTEFVVSGPLAVLLAGIWFACGRRGIPADVRYHLPIGLGLLVILIGTALDPNDHSADIAYPMLPMVCALVLFPLRHAWPYVAEPCSAPSVSSSPVTTPRAGRARS